MLDKFFRNKIFLTVLNIFVAIISGITIIWQLWEHWNEILKAFSFSHFSFFIVALVLMPINWLFEAIKWRILIKPIEEMSFLDALKNVVAGLPYGIITPARMGEWYGRIRNFRSKKQGFLLSSVGGFSQQIATITAGIIALIYMKIFNAKLLFFAGGVGILLLGLSFWLVKKNYVKQVKISSSDFFVFFYVLIFSFLRYAVFVSQYVLLLNFFSVIVPLDIMYSVVAISYLLSYLLPVNSLVDLGLRSSATMILFTPYTVNLIGVVMAGLTVWIINVAIPASVGSFLLLRESAAFHKNF